MDEDIESEKIIYTDEILEVIEELERMVSEDNVYVERQLIKLMEIAELKKANKFREKQISMIRDAFKILAGGAK